MTTIEISQNTFHGTVSVPITGTNWRAWNQSHLAVDMTTQYVREMYRPGCHLRSCTCSGCYYPEPASSTCGPYGPGTWLVPLAWITEAHRAEHTEIADAYRLCEDWLAQEMAKIPPELQRDLNQARNNRERQELLEHATTPGECDAEYCPWGALVESRCIRKQHHDPNCRCPDCCEMDNEA